MPKLAKLIEKDGTKLSYAPWNFGKISQSTYTHNAFINKEQGSRDNPRAQLPKMRVKHPPSPGEGKTIETHPYERVNIECAVPRTEDWKPFTEWFNDFDMSFGVPMTHANQKTVWPRKRPKKMEDLVPEGLYRMSVQDGFDKKTGKSWLELGWEPSFRIKAVPPERQFTDKQTKVTKVVKSRNPTRVYVLQVDAQGKKVLREGTLADISVNDYIVPSVDWESWWASKDGSGITYRVDELAVYKADMRPDSCQLQLDDDVDTSVTVPDGPMVKRTRVEPEGSSDSTDAASAAAEAAAAAVAAAAASGGGGGEDDIMDQEGGF
jgi:hypothetical protein